MTLWGSTGATSGHDNLLPRLKFEKKVFRPLSTICYQVKRLPISLWWYKVDQNTKFLPRVGISANSAIPTSFHSSQMRQAHHRGKQRLPMANCSQTEQKNQEKIASSHLHIKMKTLWRRTNLGRQADTECEEVVFANPRIRKGHQCSRVPAGAPERLP